MDIEYDNKLKAIMTKHNTGVWNNDCKNDPDYAKAMSDKYGTDMYIDTDRGKRPYVKGDKLRIGSYTFHSKRRR